MGRLAAALEHCYSLRWPVLDDRLGSCISLRLSVVEGGLLNLQRMQVAGVFPDALRMYMQSSKHFICIGSIFF